MKKNSKHNSFTILRYVDEKDFINIVQTKPDSIVSSTIVPPKLGSGSMKSLFKLEIAH